MAGYAAGDHRLLCDHGLRPLRDVVSRLHVLEWHAERVTRRILAGCRACGEHRRHPDLRDPASRDPHTERAPRRERQVEHRLVVRCAVYGRVTTASSMMVTARSPGSMISCAEDASGD